MLVKLFLSLVLLAYPAVVYYGLTHNMAWVGLLLLGLFFIRKAIVSKKKRLQSVVIIVGLVVGAWVQQASTVKLLPVVIHSALFIVFWQSLKTDVPVIERFARLDFEVMPVEIMRHCYQMTQIWAMFFASNAIFCFYLAFWASDELWTLYNGLVVYGLLAMLVVGEYIWRRVKFPHLKMSSLRETAIKISKGGHHIWGRD